MTDNAVVAEGVCAAKTARRTHLGTSGVEDGKPKMQLMGLVALHVLRWTPNGYDPVNGIEGAFVASTFEQIDNVTTNAAKDGTLIKPKFYSGQLPTPQQLEDGFDGKIPLEIQPDKSLPKPEPVGIYRAAAQRLIKPRTRSCVTTS